MIYMFAKGKYQHADGWFVLVDKDGTIFVSPDAPAFVNIKDFFDESKWTKIS